MNPRRVRIELCQSCAAKLRAELPPWFDTKMGENEVQRLPLEQRETLGATFLRVLCDRCLEQAALVREPKPS